MRKFSFIERLIAVCCTLAIMLSFPWTPVSAAAETGTRVTASTNASVKQGNSAYGYVYIDSMESLSTLEVTVHFDPAVVQVTGSYNQVEALVYDWGSTESTLQYTYIFDGNGENAKTQLFYFEYLVRPDAPVGAAYFDIVVGDAFDASFNTLPISGSRCNFTVARAVTDLSCSIRGTSSVSTAVNQEFTLSYRFNTTAIASGSLVVHYDPELFALAEVTQGAFLNDKMTDINTSLSGAVYLSFLGAAYGNSDQLLTLRFKTLKNVSQTSAVTVSVTDLYDLQLNPISCSGYSTTVTVTHDPTVDENAPFVFLEPEYDAQTQTVTVRVQLEENAHLGAGDFVLQFDTQRLAYQAAVKGYNPTFFNINDKNIGEGLLKFSVISLTDMTAAVTMLTATFQVITPCENTATKLEISGSGLANYVTDPIVLNFTGCTVESAGHTAVIDAAVAPTCLETGLTEGSHCAVCQGVLVKQEVVSARGHDEISHEAVAPTCTEIGWDAYVTCSRCDYTTYTEIPANGHTFQKGVCIVCGASQDPGKTWDVSSAADGSLMAKLYLNADGTYDLQLTGSGPMKSWVYAGDVPWYNYNTKITGLRLPEGITSIGDYAFCDCSGLQSLTLPESLVTVGSFAFNNCTGLTEIILPESLTTIEGYAFYNCKALVRIDFRAVAMDDLTSYNQVFAYSGQRGDGITVTVGSGVTKIPAYLFYPSSSASYAPNLKSVVFEEGSACQRIGRNAFDNCTGLTEITLPKSLTTIEGYAFYNCTGLTGITWPESLVTVGSFAFNNCTGLTEIILPESLTTIEEYAFNNCTGLTEITLPESLTTIEGYAFYNCKALVRIDFRAVAMDDLTSYNQVFSYSGQQGDGITVTVGSGVTKIPAYLFYPDSSASYAPNLKSVVFEEGSACQSIGRNAFYRCETLRELHLPTSLKTIGSDAFAYCRGLEKIRFDAVEMEDLPYDNYTFIDCGTDGEGIQLTIGDQVTRIPAHLLNVYDRRYTVKLSAVVFAENSRCESIGAQAFYNATGFTQLVLPEGLTTIENAAFCYCTDLRQVSIPESVTAIGDSAFSSCQQLSQVNIPEGITAISEYLFSDCRALQKVDLPEGVVTIGKRAFSSCTALTELTLPGTLKSVGDEAFWNCTGLKQIYFNAVAMDDLDYNNYVFSNCGKNTDGLTLTVGSGVTKIPAYLFYPSTGPEATPKVTRIVFEENSACRSIGNTAFCHCTTLQEVVLPEGLTTIGSQAFGYCSALKAINLPASLTDIGGSAFMDCSSVESIRIDAVALNDLANNSWNFSECGKDSSNGLTVTVGSGVTKIPAYLFYPHSNYGYEPWITSVIFEEGSQCASIGAYAFYRVNTLKSILLPESVNQIGSYAFYNCSQLAVGFRSAQLPASMGSNWKGDQRYCLDVKEIVSSGDALYAVLNSGSAVLLGYCGSETFYAVESTVGGMPVTKVGHSAFRDNTTLTEIALPEEITVIGPYAFYGCTGLTEITLPESLTMLGSYAFYGCAGLTEIVLPDGLTTLESYTFSECNGLAKITLPESLTTLGNSVFYSCESLEKVYIPDTVTAINSYAFCGCTALKEVNLPESLTQIGMSAFSSCNHLTQIYFNATAMPDLSYGNYVFAFCGSAGNGITVTVGSNVTRIPGYLFHPYNSSGYMPKITVVEFEEGSQCQEIGYRAFYKCDTLTGISIPSSVTSIGYDAFGQCSALGTAFVHSVAVAQNIYNTGLSAHAKTLILPATVDFSDSRLAAVEDIMLDGVAYKAYSASEHQWEEYMTLIPHIPCQQDGLVRYHCALCDAYKDVTQLKHIPDAYEAREPDCVNVGWYAYEACADCGYTTYVEIPALGHIAQNPQAAGKLPYTVQNDGTYPFAFDGTTYRSTNKANLSSASFTITAVQDCILDVSYKVSSEASYDWLYVYYNGAWLDRISGEQDWQTLMLQLNAGDTVMITYEKDGGGSFGEDTGWFRLMNLVPADQAEPDCLNPVVCYRCQEELKAALGHDLVAHESREETCTEIGWDAYESCSRCEYTTYVEIPALGHDLTAHEAQAVSCLEIGWDAYDTCSRCDYSTYAEIPALGHDIVACEAREETCTEIGWNAYESCSRCDYTTYVEIPALGHDKIPHEARAVTCLEIGWDAYDTCSRCDYSTYAEIPALGHDIVKHEAQAPDCTEIGWDAYDTCSRCDYSTYAELPATGHWVLGTLEENDPTYPFTFDGESYASSNKQHNTISVYTITALRSCTMTLSAKVSSETSFDKLQIAHNGMQIADLSGEVNWQQYVLELEVGDVITVSYRKDKSVAAGQDTGWFRYVLSGEGNVPVEDVQPTCTEAVICSYCGQLQKEALGHQPVYRETLQPTCVEVGYDIHQCTRCDYTEKHELPALGHAPIPHEAVAPTCTEIGWDAYETCSRCDYTTYKEIPANGHSFVETICTVCGVKQTPYRSWDVSAADDGSLMAHLYENFVDGGYELELVGSGATKNYSYNAPWYSQGYNYSINRVTLPEGLTVIGNQFFYSFTALRQIRIPGSVEQVGSYAFGYSANLVISFEGDTMPTVPSYGWNEGCGAYLNPQKVILEADATYVIDQSGKAILAKYVGSDREFVARETVEGIPVTGIGDFAFYNKTNLKTYWIPKAVTAIGANAFYGCKGLALLLEKEQLPASLGSGWNGGCSYYTGAQLWTEEDFLFVKDSKGQLDLLCYQGSQTDITVPAQPGGYALTRISAYAFYGSNLQQVVLPEGITSIGTNAFESCNALKTVKLPESLVEIKAEAFKYCGGLQTIRLPEGLQRMENGVFWGCSSLKEVRIPDGVTSLSSTTFTDCSGLEKVTLPKDLSSMGFMQFYGCTSLKEIELPEGVHSLESNSFYNCRSLKVVYVRSAQLAAKLIGSGYPHEMVQNAEVVVVPAGAGTDYLKGAYPYCETRERNGMTVDVYSTCAHQWSSETVTEYVHCQSDGYVIHSCGLCGVQTDTRTPRHTYTESLVAPTCTEDGYTLHACPDCGDSYRTDPLTKLGHDANAETLLCNRCGGEAYLLHLNNGIQVIGYNNWEEAMWAAPYGGTIQLRQDISGDVVLSKTMFLDLNGYSIEGTLTVAAGNTLYGTDSATADFAGSYGVIGAVSGTFVTDVTDAGGRRYIALTDDTGVSFHRLQLQLHTVSLRTANAGIYYKASIECDDALRSAITRHGVALSLSRMPGADFKTADHYTYMDGAPTGDFTSGSVVNIFRSDLTAEENAARGQMKIYANAYLQLADGTVLMADTTTGDTVADASFDGIAWSLQDVLTVLNRDIDLPAYADKRQQILAFCEIWKDALSGWQLTNLVK